MGLLREYLKNDLKELQENNARIVFIGERSMLAEDIVAKMNDIEKQTAGNTDFTLCLAISYGARQEILNAVKSAAQKLKSGIISAEDIDERYFSGLLYTKDIPDPDMLVRTSGEQRISNYLLWQYSELCFLDVLWPDFGRKELEMVIENYQNRERRYGKK